MNTLKIVFKVDRLLAVNHTFKYRQLEPVKDRKIRATRSIMEEVRAKCLKKEISANGRTKPFNIAFKYYEADVLEKYLRMFIGTDMVTSYQSTLIEIVANDLNQKLA